MIEVEIEDAVWTQALPEAEAIVQASALAALVLHRDRRERGRGTARSVVEGASPSTGAPDAPSTAVPAVPLPRGASLAGEECLTILLTDDDTVRDLNARFRDKDAPTNVLSFPAPESARPHLGDVALAFGVCAREAAEQGKPLAHHLSHLVAHGVLHLLGYDHMSDGEAEDMEALERRVLAGLDIPDPYRPDPIRPDPYRTV